MRISRVLKFGLPAALLALVALPAAAQSFSVQCPTSTPLHPAKGGAAGAIKCQHISGGDGFATMGDGTQTYLFAFGPLSGLDRIAKGLPGTQDAVSFNREYDAAKAPNAAIKDPQLIMGTGVLNGNFPAPLMAIDEDDEFFLTLSNVGMIMRPDLFEQHTVHFHGYPNASSYFDGVPDASVAINIAGSFTYYYNAPDAGTYFWHCHITPPEHLQMGMVGQLYVRPRQNRVPVGQSLYQALMKANQAVSLSTAAASQAGACGDLLCTGQTPLPAADTSAKQPAAGITYAYNDGDGSTRYDVEYPIQMMGFDPDFHFVGMTFNAESFAGLKDKYFMLNGRSYPDTVAAGPMETQSSDGKSRQSQPMPATITINKTAGQTRALLRISDLSVSEHTTLATIGVPMTVIAQNARLLRDMAGNNLYYNTNSVTLGGGESMDVLLDVSNIPAGTYFLYSTNLDHLSNDAENFGGMMTEIRVL
ncbi:multicopper oxidase domain-containing protein [Noviherbaspirillum pedocola]|uniref:Multicopper oxidase domain-containing protein n=1 Tax=Noviherbaspirillum pedocola TaxID=2801341 RepID=A0A934SUA4_9BURK|nr:multicopper oxidase domain-containing protein [Noviherbaspirillum pedocola]MBK4735832.1 multicopper oxidase domain-containing protein [Noviherbaspirillum pedocola]